MTTPPPIRIDYFSDLLCVLAYAAQIRLDELEQHYAGAIDIHQHFIPVFGCTQRSIAEAWKEKGGFPGYSAHVKQIARPMSRNWCTSPWNRRTGAEDRSVSPDRKLPAGGTALKLIDINYRSRGLG